MTAGNRFMDKAGLRIATEALPQPRPTTSGQEHYTPPAGQKKGRYIMNNATYTPEIADVYGALLSIQQVMDLTLESMHSCLKPDIVSHSIEELRADRLVLFHQLGEISDCIKMLEQIDPKECDPAIF